MRWPQLQRHSLALVFALLAWPMAAQAQSPVNALTLRLGTTGTTCRMSAGAGSPEGAVTGAPCSYWLQTDSPYDLWRKYSGTGNTGWIKVTNGSATWGTGTVTSVGLSVPSLLSVSGSPVTSNGTLAVAWNATSGTVPYFSGASTLAAGTALMFDGDTLDVAGDIAAYSLSVQSLVAADVMATIGGRVVVAPTTYLTAALASGGTTMTTMHNNLANGDRVVLEANGQLEWIAVASAAGGSAGAYTYTVTRNLDASGANDWAAGDAVMNTGTTGDGYIDLASDTGLIPGSTVGPTIAFNVRTGTTWNQISPRAAVGNLNGLFDYATDTYGAAFGDKDGPWLKVDATNGVRLGYDATTRVQIDSSGAASFNGSVTVGNGASYSADGAVKFSHQTGREFGQTGDIYGLWGGNSGTQDFLSLESSVVGTGNFSGEGGVYVKATGWDDAGAGSATTTAYVFVRSAVGVSRVTLAAGGELAWFENGDFVTDGGTGSDLGTATYAWDKVYGTTYYSGASAGISRTCNGTSPGGITFVGGIMTSCTAVEPLDPLAPTVDTLHAEVAELRQLVWALIGGRR
jgi:hypothetical protein